MSGVYVELRPSRVQRYTLDLAKTYIKRNIGRGVRAEGADATAFLSCLAALLRWW